ncbi:MAG: glycosyl hydrolase [Pirellulaceae bacterium]
MTTGTFALMLCGLLTSALCQARAEGVAAALPDANRSLEDRFACPPGEARILPIQHALPVEANAQDVYLRQLQERGFGGMATNVKFADYLRNEDYWKALRRGLEEAKRQGLALWLYDERGYPSGNAGGQTMEGHPEWQAQGLLIAHKECRGGLVTLECPPGTLFRAAAFPVVNGQLKLDGAVDLAGAVKQDKLVWEAPVGDWRVMVITQQELYEGTHAAVSLADKLPYINLLLPEPTARFLELTHAAYAAHLDEDLGKWFVATFTDEPSLMSLYMSPQPWSVLPWSSNLPVEFAKRRGYPLEAMVPLLIWGSGPETAKTRHDFWQTVGDLVSENYFGQIQQWCRKHNTLSGGHLLMEEAILTHVPLYGDFFRCARRLDAPSMDCLTSIPSEVPWYVGRLISSIAELEGRTVTMSESSDHSQRWRAKGDQRPVYLVSEAEIRGSLNRLIVNGITTFTSYYAFKELTTEQLVRLNNWTGRCCTMLKGGRQVADLAVVYPADTMAARFSPSRSWVHDAPASAGQVQNTYDQASRALFDAGRDFTYVDAQALSEGVVKDGSLCVRDLSWRMVILPCVDTLPLRAWENLVALWKSGGGIIALSALPVNSETDFPSPAVQAAARDLFGDGPSAEVRTNAAGGFALYLTAGQQGLLPQAVAAFLAPDVEIPTDASLHATHRRIDGQEVFFLINDSAHAWSGSIGLCAGGQGEQWNPATGERSTVLDPQTIALQLEPYGGMLFRFAEAVVPAKQPVVTGPLPGLASEVLPQVAPTLGSGTLCRDVPQRPLGGDGTDRP